MTRRRRERRQTEDDQEPGHTHPVDKEECQSPSSPDIPTAAEKETMAPSGSDDIAAQSYAEMKTKASPGTNGMGSQLELTRQELEGVLVGRPETRDNTESPVQVREDHKNLFELSGDFFDFCELPGDFV